MECARFFYRRSFLAPVAILALTAGCSSRQTWPVVDAGDPVPRGGVNVIEGDDVTIPIRTMERFITNRLPGIVIRGTSIIIRGNSTFAATSTNQALIMVDGRDMDTVTFLNMNPVDVERIEVLRGSEAAFYGRRGANGVLVVTTKSLDTER